jgi:hypothetical protein
MYARWKPTTDTIKGELFLRRLQGSLSNPRSKDVLESRIREEIRDSNTSQSENVQSEATGLAGPPEATGVAEPLSVSRRAAALAGEYYQEAVDAFPIEPGSYVKGGSHIMRLWDNPLKMVIHAGASDTWQEESNAQLKRRLHYRFYKALLFRIVEQEDMGAIYLFKRHLSPETIPEDKTYLRNLHSRITRHKGDYVDFNLLWPDGWWVYTYSNYDDRTGNTEPTGAVADEFAGILAGLGPSPSYKRTKPVNATEAWTMAKTRTKQWQAIGSRSIPDIAHYAEIEDYEDEQTATRFGVKTWTASDQEVMGRAPETISYSRHFLGVDKTAGQMLAFAKELGFWLYPPLEAELEAAIAQAAADKREARRVQPKPPSRPPPQGRLAV